ncbi:MAG TPA: transaldolase [Candidatus Lustribacter sp.]|nr:transaldolase [Candidatus Lustribacter sp.]
MTARLADLTGAGVSIWLDDLSRERLRTGSLQAVVDTKYVTGVTTNPSIFAAALAQGDAYRDQVAELAAAGADGDAAAFALTTSDVRDACDVLRPVYDRTGGVDGRVSIEVDPRLARQTAPTIEAARVLHDAVGRPNVMVKIPATVEGLPAITATLAAGISVNVTLIFSLQRYRDVMNAFLRGLEQANEMGRDLSTIHSVASFFVSRIDTEIDKRLDAIGSTAAVALKGQAGIANARLAYHAYEEVFSTPRWRSLADEGAHAQRPLWASTGVKDPAYPDTMYVTELVAAGVVNTMPEKTLDATADHGPVRGDTVRHFYDGARLVFDGLDGVGVSYTDVVGVLEGEGVEKFEKSWADLLAGVSAGLAAVGAP